MATTFPAWQESPWAARFREQAPLAALAGLAGLVGLVALLAWLLPQLVYYPFVWKYYWGPIVSDYAGDALTRGGHTARAGYNPFNTLTWAAVLGVSIWNLLAYFRRHDVRMTRALTYSLVPMIIAGGTMRGLVEIEWLSPPWAYLFITPNIYFVFFFYTLAALLVGLALERRTSGRIRHWHATLVAGLLAMGITWAGWGTFITTSETVRWIVLWEIFGYSALLTGAVVLASWKLQFARDPYYVLVLYGQIVDGMQNYIGITQGYASKLMGTNYLGALLGDPGLLIGKIVLFVPMLAYLKARVEPEEDGNMLHLVLLAILALGLAMGFHGGVPMLIGE